MLPFIPVSKDVSSLSVTVYQTQLDLQQVLLLDVGPVKADVVTHDQPLLPLPARGAHAVGWGLQGDEVTGGQLAGPRVPLLDQTLTAPRVPGKTHTHLSHD